jgi:CheY-like chemotaxis protein/preprotein translocase subunit SecB
MNGIIGFAEVLKKSELNSQQREFVNIISKSATSLLDIINDILDFSKIESGKLDIEHAEFNLFDEFEPVIELFSAKTYEKNIKLISFIHPKLPASIYGDSLRVKQILINLIGNAIKFTPDGGVVRISISTVAESTQSVKVLFSVEDTGIGIPESKQELIFTPFSQADTSTSRKFGGTGLGLAISTKLLSLMGSKLQLESEVGKGSRFFFEVDFSVENKKFPHKFEAQQDLNVAIFHSPETEIYEELLNDYLGAFDLNSIRFKTVEELEKIAYPKAVIFLTTVIDLDVIDFLTEHEISRILITDKQFELSDSEKDYFDEVIHHPINGSKIFDALIKYIDKLSDVEHSTDDSHEPISFAGKNVLVVEDNDVNQQLISFMLEMLEINVVIAEDGRQGVDTFKDGEFDLILMDINMPVMNGLEATKEIIDVEKLNNSLHTPIVALTANAIKGDRERFISYGMDDYLSKPIDKGELDRILNTYLK